jgi:hypothetical protein
MEAALRCRKRRGTGSSRTLGSPGHSGVVSLAGYGPAATNFGAAAVGTCRETAAIAATSALLGSIPLGRRWRKMWRCFPASRRGSGRLLAAAEDDGHGGRACHWERAREEERDTEWGRRRAAREEIRRRRRRPGAAPRSLLGLGSVSRRWRGRPPGSLHAAAP